ncbi:WG repeat-containing protein [Flammeovirgaceae bacterium SG7u.111]|nr:WG repeat-containing protein [Flammeovirgaceae bacterium SG7u.132]WPO38201.1 WG repeat-containing protein [Flammeovirgaceae bacterium SG7u.111]
MKTKNSIVIVFSLLTLLSCRKDVEQEMTGFQYFDIQEVGASSEPPLVAVSDEGYLEYGSSVAYVDMQGDTVIPFGKYAYFGADSLIYYATVLEHPNDSTWGRKLAIDKHQNILFDLMMFDNGPDYFSEGFTRVLRNGKMGFANKYGKVVIPCIYDFAKPFENGKAEVTFDAKEVVDLEEHRRVESDEWFVIDKKGERIE